MVSSSRISIGRPGFGKAGREGRGEEWEEEGGKVVCGGGGKDGVERAEEAEAEDESSKGCLPWSEPWNLKSPVCTILLVVVAAVVAVVASCSPPPPPPAGAQATNGTSKTSTHAPGQWLASTSVTSKDPHRPSSILCVLPTSSATTRAVSLTRGVSWRMSAAVTGEQ